MEKRLHRNREGKLTYLDDDPQTTSKVGIENDGRDPVVTNAFLTGTYANRVEYTREYKRRRRDKNLPDDRICPKCFEIKIRSRQWVVTPEGAICLSCFRKT